MTLLVVIEVKAPNRRLPCDLCMAAVTLHQSFAVDTVWLIVFVAGTADRLLPQVSATSGLVLFLVAIFAVDNRVLALERPARVLVIKALLPFRYGCPGHHVEGAPLMIEVAALTALLLHRGGRVIALARSNPCPQVIVVMTIETLVSVNVLLAVDVAVVATIRIVPRRVLSCEIARR